VSSLFEGLMEMIRQIWVTTRIYFCHPGSKAEKSIKALQMLSVRLDVENALRRIAGSSLAIALVLLWRRVSKRKKTRLSESRRLRYPASSGHYPRELFPSRKSGRGLAENFVPLPFNSAWINCGFAW
jgi:hypothetical protein